MNVKKTIYNTFLILISLIIVCLIISLYKEYKSINKTKTVINNVLVIKNNLEEDNLSINKLQTIFSNNDIIGILKVGSIINEPIVQTTNNTYYLDHTINNEYSVAGSIFMDYRTNFFDKQINIYGHNSVKVETPFKKLKNYLNKDFYLNNKYIEIYTDDNIYTYEIFSVAVEKDVYEHEKISFNTNEKWDKHFNILKNNSIYNTNIEVTGLDSILVLQTCLSNNKLLIISSRKV